MTNARSVPSEKELTHDELIEEINQSRKEWKSTLLDCYFEAASKDCNEISIEYGLKKLREGIDRLTKNLID